jgi:hypothetical protein
MICRICSVLTRRCEDGVFTITRESHAGDDEKAKSAFRKKYKKAAPPPVAAAASPVEAASSRTDALLAKARELRAGRLGAAPPAASPRRGNGDRAPAPRQRGTVLWFEAVWKSNFGRLTPSTRRFLRSCVCAMAWRLVT